MLKLIVILLLLFIYACTTTTPQQPQNPPEIVEAPVEEIVIEETPVEEEVVIEETSVEEETPEMVIVEPVIVVPTENTENKAVTNLVSQADTFYANGDYSNSYSILERALRIDPNNADIWYRMGLIKLREGEYDQAIQFAMKAVNKALGDKDILGKAWLLVADAKTATGDIAGAEAAQAQAGFYN